MNISNVGPNQTEIRPDTGGIILMSYQTPVAFIPNAETKVYAYITDEKWSITTTKHIRKFLAKHEIGEKATKVNQSFFYDIAKKANIEV